MQADILDLRVMSDAQGVQLEFNSTNEEEEVVSIFICNMLGALQYRTQESVNEGKNLINIDLSLIRGTYSVKIISEKGDVKTLRFRQ